MGENTGIGKWTKEQFIKVMKTGQVPYGVALRYPMQAYSNLTDPEVRAIYVYPETVRKLIIRVERKLIKYCQS